MKDFMTKTHCADQMESSIEVVVHRTIEDITLVRTHSQRTFL